jgi:ligand-binding SRPBCC domain-containing protein
MKVGTLQRQQKIEAPLEVVFAFFSEARNLDRITPPWLHFKVIDQTDRELQTGTLIRYRLAWHGMPMGWTTLIEEWSPPARFVDVQLKGPYRLWRHTHGFEACDGGTLIKDRVEFAVPLGVLGDLFAGWMVRRDVERIFDFRAAQIEMIFRQGPGMRLGGGAS